MTRSAVSQAAGREVLQNHFHTTKTFYQARQLESLSQRTLHMRPEVMLELLEQLVDEGLVRKEKIGACL